MRRHFVERSAGTAAWTDQATVRVPRGGAAGRAAWAFLSRPRPTRFGGVLTALRPLWEPALTRIAPDAEPRATLGGPADLIFTVAHGTAWMTARRAARATGLPLATVFHDWAPDFEGIPGRLRPIWDRAFRRLARDSAATLCVSGGMVRELGPHRGGQVLPPIPDALPAPRPPRVHEPGEPIRLFYAGACGWWYRERLSDLLRAVAAEGPGDEPAEGPGDEPAEGPGEGPGDGGFAAEVCGIETEGLPADLGPRVRIHGDVPVAERARIAAAADVAIVVLPFETVRTRHLRTHFPSKLIEYCALGRPALVWGPPGCSSIEWAERTGAAIACADPSRRGGAGGGADGVRRRQRGPHGGTGRRLRPHDLRPGRDPRAVPRRPARRRRRPAAGTPAGRGSPAGRPRRRRPGPAGGAAGGRVHRPDRPGAAI